MDTPSKERLAGAIIFVVLIVLLVPEILSGPRHVVPAAGSSANSSTRTYTIDLGNPVKPAAAPTGDVKPPALPPPVTNTLPGTSDLTRTPASSVPPPAQARNQTGSKPAPATMKAGASKESWSAQLGSFAKAENAERLATTLRAKGYRAFVSPIGAGSHVLHRVRVGPEPTREAAEALIARLKRDGQSAAVVNLP
jgi:DedD protein